MMTMFKKSLTVLVAVLMLLTAVMGVSAEEVLLKLGDTDQNGTVNTTDARLVLQFAAEMIELDPLVQTVSDVNADDITNTTDARLILQYAAGVITLFPAETVTTTELADSIAQVEAFLSQYETAFTKKSVKALREEVEHASALVERGDDATNAERVDAVLRLIAALNALEVAD